MVKDVVPPALDLHMHTLVELPAPQTAPAFTDADFSSLPLFGAFCTGDSARVLIKTDWHSALDTTTMQIQTVAKSVHVYPASVSHAPLNPAAMDAWDTAFGVDWGEEV